MFIACELKSNIILDYNQYSFDFMGIVILLLIVNHNTNIITSKDSNVYASEFTIRLIVLMLTLEKKLGRGERSRVSINILLTIIFRFNMSRAA